MRAVAAIACCLVALVPSVRGQPPQVADRWRLGVSPLIARQMQAIQLQVIGGRLAIVGDGKSRESSGTSVGRNGYAEKLSLVEKNGAVGLEYEQTSQRGRFSFVLRENGDLSISYAPNDPTARPAWSLTQPARKPLQWRLGPEETARCVQAESFWELLAAEPNWSRSTLIPLLVEMFPNCKLGDDLDQIQAELVALAEKQPKPAPTKQWSEWVDDLGAKKFAKREAAQRQLVAAGRDIIPFLKGLTPGDLDAEQRSRIRAILTELVGDGTDSPQFVAEGLASGSHGWLGLLESDDRRYREAGLARLRRLATEPIDFDPAAAAELRAAQLDRIRAKFEPAKGASGASQE